MAVQPRTEPGEPWSSGAGMTIPGKIASGERVTAIFWARAVRPVRLTVGLQGGAPGYARFATTEVALPLLCDENLRAAVRARGDDPDALVGLYIDLINRIVRGRPAGMTIRWGCATARISRSLPRARGGSPSR